MDHISLENELKRRIKMRRIIEASVSAAFLIIAIAFMIVYEQSKVVEEIDMSIFGKYQSVTYNHNLGFGIAFGWTGYIFTTIFYIADLIHCKFETIEVGSDYITFYRGMHHINLYVNGECKDGVSGIGDHLEAPLSEVTKVFVALGRWTAHLTFSNGRQAIDL